MLAQDRLRSRSSILWDENSLENQAFVDHVIEYSSLSVHSILVRSLAACEESVLFLAALREDDAVKFLPRARLGRLLLCGASEHGSPSTATCWLLNEKRLTHAKNSMLLLRVSFAISITLWIPKTAGSKTRAEQERAKHVSSGAQITSSI